MAASTLRTLRERFSPLYRLWRNRFVLTRIWPLLDRQKFTRLHGVNWPVRVRLLRHMTLIVDNRIAEPGPASALAALVPYCRPLTFWDVGANIGLYSWMVLSADPAARALLFEPDPDNLDLLRRTVARSRIDRAEIVAAAVGAEAGTIEFLVDRYSGATGTIDTTEAPFVARHFGIQPEPIQVPMTTLDAMLAGHPPPSLMKIDVEGAEPLVIRGAGQVLEQHRPPILLECGGRNRPEVLGRLEGLGYAILGADRPDAPLDETYNLLALPPRLMAEREAFIGDWQTRFDALRR